MDDGDACACATTDRLTSIAISTAICSPMVQNLFRFVAVPLSRPHCYDGVAIESPTVGSVNGVHIVLATLMLHCKARAT